MVSLMRSIPLFVAFREQVLELADDDSVAVDDVMLEVDAFAEVREHIPLLDNLPCTSPLKTYISSLSN